MANRKPLVLASGEIQQLRSGDTLTDGAGNPLLASAYSILIGNGSTNPWVINHQLNTTNVLVAIKIASTGEMIEGTITVVDANNISINFAFEDIPTTNQYSVTVFAGGSGLGGGAAPSTASLDFTDGDTLKRFTILNPSINSTVGFTSLCVIRPTTLESADRVYFYQAQIISVTTGLGFEVLVAVTDGEGEQVTDMPPNEVVTLCYSQASGSGGVSALVTPDVPPVIANTKDDEFNGAALDPKWSWVNQGSTTYNIGQGMISIFPTLIATTNIVLLAQVAPSPPWTLTAKIAGHALFANTMAFGIAVRDSGGGKLRTVTFGYAGSVWGLQVTTYNSVTSVSAFTFAGINNTTIPQELYLRITDDNTNIICSYSIDGRNFTILHSEARLTFLPALNQIGIATNHANLTVPSVLSCDWFRIF